MITSAMVMCFLLGT